LTGTKHPFIKHGRWTDQALFVLAMCAKLGDEKTAGAAYQALPRVARTGMFLFQFCEYVKAFGGLGGNGFKRAIARWYNGKSAKDLCFQVLKYQQREGWSHRDLLRLSHAEPATDKHVALFDWIAKGWHVEDGSKDAEACAKEVLECHSEMADEKDHPLRLLIGFEMAKRATSVDEVVRLIEDYRLPHECVPTKWKSQPEVKMALLPWMPPHTLIRNLGSLTAVGLVTNTSEATAHIIKVLTDQDRLAKARLHPMTILMAMQTYDRGHGDKGKLNWHPAGRVVDAIDKAFYLAFKSVRPTGKRLCLALDVSGSMRSPVTGARQLSCRAAAGAMALVTANVEPLYEMVAFTTGGPGFVPMRQTRSWGGTTMSGIQPITISPRMRMDTVVKELDRSDFGGTDCALPMLWAMKAGIEIDAFIIYTDNESWAGDIHPSQALKQYRDKMGIDAKLIAVALGADRYSVADPSNANMMDVVGMDTATPNIISDFISGEDDNLPLED